MKMVKTVVSLIMLCAMTLSLAACGGSSSGALSEEDYVKEIEKVGTAMVELQNNAASATDVEGAKKLLEDLKTQFNNMAQLNAPDKYKDAQAKIKSGSEAMVKYIDMALKAADGTMPSADDQQKMMEYITTAMTDLQAGIAAVQS